MRSMAEIMGLIVDGKINTKEEAAAFVTAEAAEMAEFYGKPLEEMRATLLSNIGYCTGYLDHDAADRILEMFETEHPIFGKGHPTAEEAYALGIEYGKRSREKQP
jgi:hypothetical protein